MSTGTATPPVYIVPALVGQGGLGSLISLVKSFSPNVLLVGGVGMLQAPAGAPAVLQGDPIGQWLDQSGNGNHCTNAGTAATKPTLNLTGTNGQPTATFDGVHNELEGPLVNSTNTGTCIVVYRNSTAANDQRIVTTAAVTGGADTGLATPVWVIHRVGPVDALFYNASQIAADTSADNAWHTVASWMDGVNGNIKVDQVATNSAALSTASISAIYCLGSASSGAVTLMTGDMAFVALWTTAVSPANISTIMAALKTTYNTP